MKTILLSSLLLSTLAFAAAPQDIRDIRGPISIESPWRAMIVSAVGIALLGAVTAMVIKRKRRARELTAEERAFAALDRARSFAEEDLPREYAGAMSDALRTYVEERFALHIAHATSDEFLSAAMAHGDIVHGDQRESLSHFLSACDLAKFARFRLADDEMSALDHAAREFVVASSNAVHAAGRSS